jgi:hypothetical protein
MALRQGGGGVLSLLIRNQRGVAATLAMGWEGGAASTSGLPSACVDHLEPSKHQARIKVL